LWPENLKLNRVHQAFHLN
jgi:hypothetical protein